MENLNIAKILEYAAFGGSLFSLYLYGQRGIKGPVVGMLTSLLVFMAFGIVTGIYAAFVANIVFLALHIKNLRIEIMGDQKRTDKKIIDAGNILRDTAFITAKDSGFWNHEDGSPRCPDEEFHKHVCLMHEELSEMVTAHKKGLMDKNLPHKTGIEVELTDLIIRAFAFAGANGYNIGETIAEKNHYNKNRPDHKLENRKKAGGKTY